MRYVKNFTFFLYLFPATDISEYCRTDNQYPSASRFIYSYLFKWYRPIP